MSAITNFYLKKLSIITFFSIKISIQQHFPYKKAATFSIERKFLEKVADNDFFTKNHLWVTDTIIFY